VRLKWTDIDFQTNKIVINEPEKGSNCGIYPVTNELISRIMTLPRQTEKIFGNGVAVKDSITNMLITARRQLAYSFCNPRLKEIHFHTLRHWAITVYAYKVKDPFLVQIFARHKDMKCTAKYIHYAKILFQIGDKDEWTVRAAKTIDEATALLQVGFEYVTYMQNVAIFRKRK
jgi:integrase